MSQEINAMVDEYSSDIESVTEEVASVKKEVVEADDAEENTSEKENLENSQEKGDNEDKENSDDFVPFPKKARNAISYRDKKIAKLEAKLRELEEATAPKQPDDGAPKEEDFDSYADFLKAQVLHEIKGEQKKSQPQVDPQRAQFIAQREQQIAQKAQEYAQSIPDYQQVLNDNIEMVDYLPPEVQDAFYQADDAALAFYNLAKSGDLAILSQVHPTQAAMMIAQAQMRQPVPAQQRAPAHKPIKAAKGTGKSGKSVNDMSPDELMNWLNN